MEPRSLLAVATLVDHDFRSDDFSLSGSFLYDFRAPNDHNYIDRITNGNFSSTSGHVDWNSPTEGTGFFEGTAQGAGHTTIVYQGATIDCSDYGIRESGRLDFSLNAATSDLTVTAANTTSTAYTSFQDQIPGGQSCVKVDPPWSRFYGGNPTLYDGAFKTTDHTVTVKYRESLTTPRLTTTSVTSPATNKPASVIQWANSAATDLTAAGSPYYASPAAPQGWQAVPQTTPVKPVTTVDPEAGGVTITAAVLGKLPKTSTPGTPLANVRLYWASSATDTTGAEIPVTSNTDPVGLYWNSAQMTARIEQLPAPPAGATHLRIAVTGPTGSDATAANSVAFVPLGAFEAAGRTVGPVTVGSLFNGSTSSLLSSADLANPDIRVFAVNPQSQAGGQVSVTNDTGAFTYNSASAAGLASLAQGETGSDTIEFLAIKNQTVLDRVTATITVVGVNDPPVATDDAGATNNQSRLTISASSLTANDTDPDHNDHVRLVGVTAVSARGATVRLLRNTVNGTLDGIEYDPTMSTELRSLGAGVQQTDTVAYAISDDLGLVDQGTIQITVTGATPKLLLGTIPAQLTHAGELLGPLTVGLFDPDGDPTDIQVTATAANAALVPAVNISVTGTGESRSLTLTPAAGLSGKTTITLNASGGGQQASTSFELIVGTATDLDLDGINDAIEDAAPNGGDMNSDGVLDRRQPQVVSARSAHGPEYFQLLTNEPHAFEQVAVRDGASDPAAPATMSLPLGVTHLELVLASGDSAPIAFRTNLATPAVNRLLQQKTAGSWTSGMARLGEGATLDTSGRMLITLADGGLLDSGPAANQRVTLDAGFAHANFPWQNGNAADVDNDGFVAPIDALVVINDLNASQSRALPPIPTGTLTIPAFLDPSGDNFVAPNDALLVINVLNSGSGEGEGEGVLEALPPALSAADADNAAPSPADALHSAALAQVLAELDPSTDWSLGANVILPAADDSATSPSAEGQAAADPVADELWLEWLRSV